MTVFSMEWRTEECARIVLDRLEKRGFHTITMTGVGQTCIWTCHRPDDLTNDISPKQG